MKLKYIYYTNIQIIPKLCRDSRATTISAAHRYTHDSGKCGGLVDELNAASSKALKASRRQVF